MVNPEEIRAEFPALSTKVYGKDLVYFDNAATSQRPVNVISLVQKMTLQANANIHRAVHKMSSDATALYETAREAVRCYINAASTQEIVFTSGATAGFNLVAHSFSDKYISPGDKIVVSAVEHHSNLVPWQFAASRKGASIEVIPVNDDGSLDMDAFRKLLDPRVKLVAVSQVSNVLGVINPVKEMIAISHAEGIPVLVDGAQGIVHTKVDVREMDCDFYIFSGHKVFAATGSGVLYGKKEYLQEMPPFFGGGDMVGRVTYGSSTYAPLPLKFEAGTPNFIAQATLAPALEWAERFNGEEYVQYTEELSRKMLSVLEADPRIRLFGTASCRIPLFSFAVRGVHHEDLALILDKMGIAVRSGQLCAEPLMDRFGVTGMLRVSLLPYNTIGEIDYFASSLDKAISMLA